MRLFIFAILGSELKSLTLKCRLFSASSAKRWAFQQSRRMTADSDNSASVINLTSDLQKELLKRYD